jgi:hypothetical protein
MKLKAKESNRYCTFCAIKNNKRGCDRVSSATWTASKVDMASAD